MRLMSKVVKKHRGWGRAPPSTNSENGLCHYCEGGREKGRGKMESKLYLWEAKQKSFKIGRGILSEADCYVSKIPRYLSEAFGIKIWHQNSFRVLLIAPLNGTNGRHLPFSNSPLCWLLMGQSVQASEPSAGSQGWRNQFVASCWPVVSDCRPTLPGLLIPPLSLSKWKGTWQWLLWGDKGFCHGPHCHAVFALLKWEKDQNITVGSFALILSAGQAMNVSRASIWCQEKTVWTGTLCLSEFLLVPSSEQSQKTKSQSWPGSQSENHAIFDFPLKARSRGYARSWQLKCHTHLPGSLVISGSVLQCLWGTHTPMPPVFCHIPWLTLHLSVLSIHF